MGSGSSIANVSDVPDVLFQGDVERLCGHRFDQGKFDSAKNSDGFISKEIFVKALIEYHERQLVALFNRCCPACDMESRTFVKIIRDSGLFDERNLTSADVDIIFKKSIAKEYIPTTAISFETFRHFSLQEIATKLKVDISHVIRKIVLSFENHPALTISNDAGGLSIIPGLPSPGGPAPSSVPFSPANQRATRRNSLGGPRFSFTLDSVSASAALELISNKFAATTSPSSTAVANPPPMATATNVTVESIASDIANAVASQGTVTAAAAARDPTRRLSMPPPTTNKKLTRSATAAGASRRASFSGSSNTNASAAASAMATVLSTATLIPQKGNNPNESNANTAVQPTEETKPLTREEQLEKELERFKRIAAYRKQKEEAARAAKEEDNDNPQRDSNLVNIPKNYVAGTQIFEPPIGISFLPG